MGDGAAARLASRLLQEAWLLTHADPVYTTVDRRNASLPRDSIEERRPIHTSPTTCACSRCASVWMALAETNGFRAFIHSLHFNFTPLSVETPIDE